MTNEQIELQRDRIMKNVGNELDRNSDMGITPLMLANIIAQNDLLIRQNQRLLDAMQSLAKSKSMNSEEKNNEI